MRCSLASVKDLQPQRAMAASCMSLWWFSATTKVVLSQVLVVARLHTRTFLCSLQIAIWHRRLYTKIIHETAINSHVLSGLIIIINTWRFFSMVKICLVIVYLMIFYVSHSDCNMAFWIAHDIN